MTNYNSSDNSGLRQTTGSGKFVGDTSPTLVTPTIGAATATSITFSPTTSGIVGTTTNDDAAAGKVGEFISSRIADASATSLSSTTPKDVTSITLTAGDWDVEGNLFFTGTSTTNPLYEGWTSLTSATLPDLSLINLSNIIVTTTSTFAGISTPYLRVSVNTNTTVYLTARAIFSAGTVKVSGGIYARRVR